MKLYAVSQVGMEGVISIWDSLEKAEEEVIRLTDEDGADYNIEERGLNGGMD